MVKCCLEGDDKAARTEATDDGPYEGIPQLTFVVGGINLNRVRVGFWPNKQVLARKVQVKNTQMCKVVLYRDTVTVEPGSRPFFGLGSVSKESFMDVGHNLANMYSTYHVSVLLLFRFEVQ